MNTYLIAYDIADDARLAKVREYVYSLSLGGQKSALLAPLTQSEVTKATRRLNALIQENDRINIIHVDSNPILFGKATILDYSRGIIII